jgi:hypothetical protein
MRLAHLSVWQAEVHDDQIWRALFGSFDRSDTIIRFANGIADSPDKFANGLAHGDVVIDN